MNSNKLTYSRTIEVGPEQAELLNHLVDKYIVPVLEKRQRIAQDAIPNRLTPEQEISSILNFGISERTGVPTRRPLIKVTQRRLNARALRHTQDS